MLGVWTLIAFVMTNFKHFALEPLVDFVLKLCQTSKKYENFLIVKEKFDLDLIVAELFIQMTGSFLWYKVEYFIPFLTSLIIGLAENEISTSSEIIEMVISIK